MSRRAWGVRATIDRPSLNEYVGQAAVPTSGHRGPSAHGLNREWVGIDCSSRERPLGPQGHGYQSTGTGKLIIAGSGVTMVKPCRIACETKPRSNGSL